MLLCRLQDHVLLGHARPGCLRAQRAPQVRPCPLSIAEQCRLLPSFPTRCDQLRSGFCPLTCLLCWHPTS